MPKVVADEQILESTLDVILEHGYEGATTRLIAAAADVNEVTLFRRFGTKDNLVLLAVKQELVSFHQAHITYTADLSADLERIVSFYDSLFGKRARFIPLIISEVPRRPVLRAGLQELAATMQELAAIISQYQDARQLRLAPPLHILMTLLAPVLGHHITASLAPTLELPFNIPDYIASFLKGNGAAKD